MSGRAQRVAVLVSGPPGGALDIRASGLFGNLPAGHGLEVRMLHHQGAPAQRIGHFLSALQRFRPNAIYMLDPIYAAVAAVSMYRLVRRVPLVVDTGDLVHALAREMGRIGRPGLAVVWAAEQLALRQATRIVVRSGTHRQWLIDHARQTAEVIPDGVDLTQFYPLRSGARAGNNAGRELVVGGMGTVNWSSKRRLAYSWELVEALALLRDAPVRGVWVGDGDARRRLEARAEELGVGDRLTLTGWVDYDRLNVAINGLDICLLTQPDSQISRVRTTGKLPLYLACDRYIIASDVGEVARLLRPLATLLPYHGEVRDEAYPERLAQRVRELAKAREALSLNGRGVQLARENFDYQVLASRLEAMLKAVLASP